MSAVARLPIGRAIYRGNEGPRRVFLTAAGAGLGEARLWRGYESRGGRREIVR